MAASEDIDKLIEQYHAALDDILKGNPEPAKKLFSHRGDVTLANPYGALGRGWELVAQILEQSAWLRRDGETAGFEIISKYVTAELAYVVEVERLTAKVGGRQDVTPYALRVTMIFRPEDGAWKVVHRHADPIIATQAVGPALHP